MESLLRITRYPYEEPHEIKICVEASNGRQKGSVEFYTDAEDLVEIGDALIDFPFGHSQEYIYEIGTEDPAARFAYHIFFRFFLVRPTGSSGIEIRFHNNRKEAPYREISEFSLTCEVAGINRLGSLMKNFGRLEHRILEWDGIQGSLSKPE